MDDNAYCRVPNLPTPELGIYNIQLHLVDTEQEVIKRCGMTAKACAYPGMNKGSTTHIYANRHNFDCYMTHEVRHATNKYWHGKQGN